ncbi:hypothetical protein [Mycobacterium riyadhense]|uniref:hypothetical protein n=1 Tax=Mycobacterium riyadhense TaxID=486698 RepID=UPI001956D4E4|nr:hypothetical protein [Mycobacterium riyadhense]
MRFGALGLLGAVTAGRVAVAASGGRLLAAAGRRHVAGPLQHESPLTLASGDR